MPQAHLGEVDVCGDGHRRRHLDPLRVPGSPGAGVQECSFVLALANNRAPESSRYRAEHHAGWSCSASEDGAEPDAGPQTTRDGAAIVALDCQPWARNERTATDDNPLRCQ